MPSQALVKPGEGVESRLRAPKAHEATVKACSRPRTRAVLPCAAAKAEVVRKSAALKSVSVRLRPRAPHMLRAPMERQGPLKSDRCAGDPVARCNKPVRHLDLTWSRTVAVHRLVAVMSAGVRVCGLRKNRDGLMLRQLAGLAGTLPLIVLLAACGQVATSSLGDSGSSAAAPSITQQPTAQSVPAGTIASFSVTATGSTPLNYQWNKNGSAIPGATSPSYSTPAAPEDDGAMFDVVVSNPVGSAQSSAAPLHVTATPVAPAITTQPAGQSTSSGQSATFNVVASGTSPLSYQW